MVARTRWARRKPYQKTQAKTDSAKSQVVWFLDVAKLVKIVIRASTKEADAQQTDVLAQELGVYGLKSVGGCLTLGTGKYDSLSKIFVHAPRPVAGLLKVFSLPPMALRPESWVPATVASYQTVSFDLDNAFAALNEIVNKFQPGNGQSRRAESRRPQRRRAAQLPEGRVRPAGGSDHRDQRLQEADQGRQPANAGRGRSGRRQGLSEHALQASRR